MMGTSSLTAEQVDGNRRRRALFRGKTRDVRRYSLSGAIRRVTFEVTPLSEPAMPGNRTRSSLAEDEWIDRAFSRRSWFRQTGIGVLAADAGPFLAGSRLLRGEEPTASGLIVRSRHPLDLE